MNEKFCPAKYRIGISSMMSIICITRLYFGDMYLNCTVCVGGGESSKLIPVYRPTWNIHLDHFIFAEITCVIEA